MSNDKDGPGHILMIPSDVIFFFFSGEQLCLYRDLKSFANVFFFLLLLHHMELGALRIKFL